VLRPGEHGSTFGGNPLACSVGHGVTAVRVRGLWAGVDIDPELMTGREAAKRLMTRGVLAKDTHGSTIRFVPPLVISEDEVHWAIDQFTSVL
jgi:ornithine--oxo-acid transaminase